MFVQASLPPLLPNYTTALDVVARKKPLKLASAMNEYFETLSIQKKAFFHHMNV